MLGRTTTLLLAMAMIVSFGYATGAHADVFNLGSGLKSLETVAVGDIGNAADASHGNLGSVSYSYSIGKYEVTTAQYVDFLNNKAQSDPYALYNSGMSGDIGCGILRTGDAGSYVYSIASGYGNRPVNYVSFWDCARFTNWLYNGQGAGDTETGAYTLNGVDWGDQGASIVRNTATGWFIASNDEWYKAALYKGGGTNTGYWTYATQSDVLPSNAVTNPDGGNNANFSSGSITNVGEFENSESAYGTFDQSGNLWEYCDTVVSGGTARGMQGCSWLNDASYMGPNSFPQGLLPLNEYQHLGFRVSYLAPVPEPGSLLALGSGLVGLIGFAMRRRK